jgi:hypothetical protein
MTRPTLASLSGAVDLFALGASDWARRWVSWLMPQDGRLIRLPSETWGPLPPLNPPAAAPL